MRVWWAFFPHVRLFFSRFGWLRVGFSGILGQFRESETTFFGILSSAQLCKACIKIAMTFTWLVVLPCSAAVRAEHIRRLPKGCRACRTVIHFILSVPASKLNASELGFRFLPPRPSPILLFLPPDPHIPPHFVRNLLLRPQNAIF